MFVPHVLSAHTSTIRDWCLILCKEFNFTSGKLHPLWRCFFPDNQQAEEFNSESLCLVAGALVWAVKPKYLRPSHKPKHICSFVTGAGLCFIILGVKQASAHLPCLPFWLISLCVLPEAPLLQVNVRHRGCF